MSPLVELLQKTPIEIMNTPANNFGTIPAMLAVFSATSLIRKYLKSRKAGPYAPEGDIAFFLMALVVAEWVRYLLKGPTTDLLSGSFYLALLVLAVATTTANTLLVASPWLNKTFGKTWVKGIDFGYLFLAFAGVVRLLNSSSIVTDQVNLLDTMSILFLALAIGFRFAKTIIEVFFDAWTTTAGTVSQPTT